MIVELREIQSKDRKDLGELLSRVANFDTNDCNIAMELITTAIKHPRQKDYDFIVAIDDLESVVGYICFGPTPLTDGTYDLYWIAVDPACAGQGIGKQLLLAMEEKIRQQQGRMIVIETSSAENYALTQQFYLKNGYQFAETIRDFYRDGEDRMTYFKRLR